MKTQRQKRRTRKRQNLESVAKPGQLDAAMEGVVREVTSDDTVVQLWKAVGHM